MEKVKITELKEILSNFMPNDEIKQTLSKFNLDAQA